MTGSINIYFSRFALPCSIYGNLCKSALTGPIYLYFIRSALTRSVKYHFIRFTLTHVGTIFVIWYAYSIDVCTNSDIFSTCTLNRNYYNQIINNQTKI